MRLSRLKTIWGRQLISHSRHPLFGLTNAVMNPVAAIFGGLTFGTKRGRVALYHVSRHLGISRFAHGRIAGKGIRKALTKTRPLYHDLRRHRIQLISRLRGHAAYKIS